MSEDEIKKIIDQLKDHESRLLRLESIKQGAAVPASDKPKTLREVIKGREFSNGPEKIAAIVGYHEKMLGSLINKKDLAKAWMNAKFDGAYKTNLLDNASGMYVRVQSNGECDLTQTGEAFFEKLLNYESASPASK